MELVVQTCPCGCGFEHPIAAPLFSKICMYRYCSFGLVTLAEGDVGGSVVAGAFFASGDVGDKCAVYISVQASITGTISRGARSARVRLCADEKVST